MARVIWRRTAVESLADCWNRASAAERQIITATSHLIDQRLAVDPGSEGESRRKGRRIAVFPPLVVHFKVSGDGQTAPVLRVNVIRRRR